MDPLSSRPDHPESVAPSRDALPPEASPGVDARALCAPAASATSSPPLVSAYIDGVIRDITGEFHDPAHARSNRTQALNLWRASGLDEETFVEVLYVARGITRARGNIEKAATDGVDVLPGARNRMPYFFAVVRHELRAAVASCDDATGGAR